MNRDELMRKIQETGFALYDLTLFLDTHPQNQMALDYFTDVQKNHTELQAEYEMMYGPLTAFDTNTEMDPGSVALGTGGLAYVEL